MTVSEPIITLLGVLMTVSFMLGLIVMTVWKIAKHGEFKPYFGGIFVYLCFSTCIKGLCDLLLLRFIGGNAWVYALYNVVFVVGTETLGRYMGFRVLHKTRTDRRDGISFGLGFGTAESILTMGLTALTYFSYALAMADGSIAEVIGAMAEGDRAELNTVLEQIANLTVGECVWAMAERAVRLVLQTSLAMLVFAAMRTVQKNLLPVSALIQLAAILPMGLAQVDLLPTLAGQIVLVLGTLCAAVLAWRAYHAMPDLEPAARRL